MQDSGTAARRALDPLLSARVMKNLAQERDRMQQLWEPLRSTSAAFAMRQQESIRRIEQLTENSRRWLQELVNSPSQRLLREMRGPMALTTEIRFPPSCAPAAASQALIERSTAGFLENHRRMTSRRLPMYVPVPPRNDFAQLTETVVEVREEVREVRREVKRGNLDRTAWQVREKGRQGRQGVRNWWITAISALTKLLIKMQGK